MGRGRHVCDHREFRRGCRELLFKLGNLLQLLPVDQWRQWIAKLFVRQPGHRNQKSHDQNDVLRDLRR